MSYPNVHHPIDPEAGPAWPLLYAAIVLAAVWLAICCATNAPRRPRAEPIRASVVEVPPSRMNYRTGELLHFLVIEYRDEKNVLNQDMVRVGDREWLLFGRQGAEVCLYPQGRDWRMAPCPR